MSKHLVQNLQKNNSYYLCDYSVKLKDSLYLPPDRNLNGIFIRDILNGKKQVFKIKEIIFIK